MVNKNDVELAKDTIDTYIVKLEKELKEKQDEIERQKQELKSSKGLALKLQLDIKDLEQRNEKRIENEPRVYQLLKFLREELARNDLQSYAEDVEDILEIVEETYGRRKEPKTEI